MTPPIRGPSRPTSTAPVAGPSRSTRHASASLGGAYTGLLRGTQLLFSLLQPHNQATTVDILSQISSVMSDITDFNKRLREADPDEVNLDEGKWQDRLDGEGTQLWNQTTIRKYKQVEGEDGEEGVVGSRGRDKEFEEMIVAKLRVIGYELIHLGAIDMNNKEVLASLLNLSTEAALACLALTKPDFNSARNLLSAGTSLARTMGSPNPLPKPKANQPPPPSSEPAKALLAHFLARARWSTMEQNEATATYAMTQIKQLEASNCFAQREKAKLAQTCHELGKMMLVQSREHRKAAEAEEDGESKAVKMNAASKRVELGRGWLMWAAGLLDEQKTKQNTPLYISSLRLLAQAYLESETPLLAEGTAALETLLEVEPSSPSLFRRYIRLCITQKHDQNKIIEAFTQAIKHLPWTMADGSKLLSEVHQLSSAQAQAKYPVVNALAEGALARLNEAHDSVGPRAEGEDEEGGLEGAGPVRFLGQLVMMVMFALGADDHPKLVDLFNKIAAGLGSVHKLGSDAAFVLATYAWRQGDSCVKVHHYAQAADWFLLAAHPITRPVHDVVGPKSRRKAALALLEINKFDQAEEILSAEQGPVLARTEFVRFNNFAKAGRVDEAQAAVRRMVGGADFEVSMLFWASEVAKEAPEASAKLQATVLGGLLELYKRGTATGSDEVDALTLIRCLIRPTAGQLETASREDRIDLATILVDHYKAGQAFAAKQLGEEGTDEDQLLKSVKWLYTSAHGVVTLANQTTDFPPALMSELYRRIADLIEIALQLGPDSTLRARLFLAKFGALGDKMRVARGAEPGTPAARAAHTSLLPRLHKLRLEVAEAKKEDAGLEGLEELQSALVGMEVEGGWRSWWPILARSSRGWGRRC